MTKESFNDGWVVQPKISPFAQLAGAPQRPIRVNLPHDAQLSLPRRPENSASRAFFPGGCFEYSKVFSAPVEWARRRVSLHFDGVYRDAVVFVNDVVAVHHANGYTAFDVPLNPYLQYGAENTVRVEARGGEDSRWYSGIGIYRDVHLVVEPLVRVTENSIRVATPDVSAELAAVDIRALMRNDGLGTRTCRVDFEVIDPEGELLARGSQPVSAVGGSEAVVRQKLFIRDPLLWSPDHPDLYRLVVRSASDADDTHESSVEFGVRRLQLDPDNGLRINGEPTKLRGACIHHDGGIVGAATYRSTEERRIARLKQAGFNAIRAAHTPLSEATLAACDRIGVLVIDEAFDVWTESKTDFDYSLAFQEWWERDVESMVSRDINHPSVIMYSIGNEIFETGSAHGAMRGRMLAEKIRELDPTRFVTNGINGIVSTIRTVTELVRAQRGAADENEAHEHVNVNELLAAQAAQQEEFMRSDLVTAATEESFAVLDVAGMNYGEARYLPDREAFPNRVIVGTETFMPRIADNWKTISQSDHVLGDFTWTGWDYLGEVGIGRMTYADEDQAFEAPYPWITAWCGDHDLVGHRRPASFYREIAFGLRTEPYLAVQPPEHFHRVPTPGSWSWSDAISSWTWDVERGTPIRVEVYADADEIELQLDGHTIERRPVGRDLPLVTVFETEYRPGELTGIAYRGAEEIGRTHLRSAGGPVGLNAAVDRSTLSADGSDISFIELELVDDAGTIVTSADRSLTVAIEGEAVLLALGSGRPDNEESYLSASHRTYEGRALAVVRAIGSGDVAVTVAGEGLPPTTISLIAEEVS